MKNKKQKGVPINDFIAILSKPQTEEDLISIFKEKYGAKIKITDKSIKFVFDDEQKEVKE